MFDSVRPTAGEVAAPRPGDEIVSRADVVMDRAFTVDAPPGSVWPWLVQLGKKRAGWYFPRVVERVIPTARRAIRHVDPAWLGLGVGDVIPDYGPDGYFEVASIDAPASLVYRAQRGRVRFTWSITLEAVGDRRTRVFLRLRLAPVKHRWLAESVGELFDLLTVAGMAAGLRERLAQQPG